MAIDIATVRRVAELARLELDADEEARVAGELSAVLEFAEALGELDLAGCEPAEFAPADSPARADEPGERRLEEGAATVAAPEAEDDYFLVPPVVEYLEP